MRWHAWRSFPRSALSPWAGHHPYYSLYFDQGSKNRTAENNALRHSSRDYFDGTIQLQTYANGTENITLIRFTVVARY